MHRSQSDFPIGPSLLARTLLPIHSVSISRVQIHRKVSTQAQFSLSIAYLLTPHAPTLQGSGRCATELPLPHRPMPRSSGPPKIIFHIPCPNATIVPLLGLRSAVTPQTPASRMPVSRHPTSERPHLISQFHCFDNLFENSNRATLPFPSSLQLAPSSRRGHPVSDLTPNSFHQPHSSLPALARRSLRTLAPGGSRNRSLPSL